MCFKLLSGDVNFLRIFQRLLETQKRFVELLERNILRLLAVMKWSENVMYTRTEKENMNKYVFLA